MQRKLSLFSLPALAAAMGLGLAGTSDAAVVTITSGPNAGEVVFDSRGYEGSTAGATPGVSDPAVGTYEFFQTNGVTVETGPGLDGVPGAFSGQNYLSIDRGAPGATSLSDTNHIFSRSIDTGTESFTVAFAWWGSTDFMAMSVGDSESDGTASSEPGLLASWGFDPRDGSLREFTNDGSVPFSDPSLIDGQWNEVELAWDHVTGVASLTINGDSRALTAIDSPATVSQFFVAANAGGNQVFIDAIPEPGSMSLLAIGAGMILRRRRSN